MKKPARQFEGGTQGADAPPSHLRPGRAGQGPRLRPRPAVFLDRDGTLIEEVHYLSDPAAVRLLPGTAEALRRLRDMGFVRVLVTNQSAIGRGMITEAQLHLIHDEMNRQLGAEGAAVDAIYFCPVAPGCNDRTIIECDDRKPGPGMLIRAAEELNLDLGASWMVGDTISDLLAGINARCRGSILVRTGQGLSAAEEALGPDHEVADDLLAAAELIRSDLRHAGDVDGAGMARVETTQTPRELR